MAWLQKQKASKFKKKIDASKHTRLMHHAKIRDPWSLSGSITPRRMSYYEACFLALACKLVVGGVRQSGFGGFSKSVWGCGAQNPERAKKSSMGARATLSYLSTPFCGCQVIHTIKRPGAGKLSSNPKAARARADLEQFDQGRIEDAQSNSQAKGAGP
jgi:hypothetical protein